MTQSRSGVVDVWNSLQFSNHWHTVSFIDVKWQGSTASEPLLHMNEGEAPIVLHAAQIRSVLLS